METQNIGTQCDFAQNVLTNETYREVEKIISVPTEVYKEMIKEVEVRIVNDRVKVTSVPFTKKIEREVINLTTKFVDKPVIEKKLRENHKPF